MSDKIFISCGARSKDGWTCLRAKGHDKNLPHAGAFGCCEWDNGDQNARGRQARPRLERIEELAKLQDGWYDGHGSAMAPLAIANAKSIAIILANLDFEPNIYPCSDGAISIELDKKKSMDIYCFGDGRIEVIEDD